MIFTRDRRKKYLPIACDRLRKCLWKYGVCRVERWQSIISFLNIQQECARCSNTYSISWITHRALLSTSAKQKVCTFRHAETVWCLLETVATRISRNCMPDVSIWLFNVVNIVLAAIKRNLNCTGWIMEVTGKKIYSPSPWTGEKLGTCKFNYNKPFLAGPPSNPTKGWTWGNSTICRNLWLCQENYFKGGTTVLCVLLLRPCPERLLSGCTSKYIMAHLWSCACG